LVIFCIKLNAAPFPVNLKYKKEGRRLIDLLELGAGIYNKKAIRKQSQPTFQTIQNIFSWGLLKRNSNQNDKNVNQIHLLLRPIKLPSTVSRKYI